MQQQQQPMTVRSSIFAWCRLLCVCLLMIHFSRRGKYTEVPLLTPDLLLEFLVCLEFVRGGLDPLLLVFTSSRKLCWVNLSYWLQDLKVEQLSHIWKNLPKKCHFQIISYVQWWTKKFHPVLHCILNIKNEWFLLKLEMALVTTIEMKFALVWNRCPGHYSLLITW